jgi:hypothetical protein
MNTPSDTAAVAPVPPAAPANLPTTSVAEPSPPAAEPEPSALSLPLEVHGFLSQGFIKSTANNYLADSKQGSFAFTEVGINFTKDLTDRMRTGVQLFARNLGSIGNYSAQFDWFYLDYRVADWFGIRVGRTKLPYGLYNETSDVDVARVPVLLPQSVYPTEDRDYLLAQNGGEIYGFVPIGAAGELNYRAYGGTLFIDPVYEGLGATLKSVTTPYIVGGRLMWGTPLAGLRLAGSVQVTRLDLGITVPTADVTALSAAGAVPAGFDGGLTAKVPAILWTTSAEYSTGDLLVTAEYGRWHTKIEDSSLPVLVANTRATSERFYLMGSYHVASWFTPGLYYSVLFPHVADRSSDRSMYQHDVAGTLRFDINAHWLLKLEGHFMHGTAALNSSLNGNAPLDTLTRDWGLFLAKMTAYF